VFPRFRSVAELTRSLKLGPASFAIALLEQHERQVVMSFGQINF